MFKDDLLTMMNAAIDASGDTAVCVLHQATGSSQQRQAPKKGDIAETYILGTDHDVKFLRNVEPALCEGFEDSLFCVSRVGNSDGQWLLGHSKEIKDGTFVSTTSVPGKPVFDSTSTAQKTYMSDGRTLHPEERTLPLSEHDKY